MINIIKTEEEGLWIRGARILSEKLEMSGGEGKKCLLLLSGGSAVNIYQKLAKYIDLLQVRSDNLAVGQVDERFRPGFQYSGFLPSETQSSAINSINIEKTGLIEVLKAKNIPFYKIPQAGTFREAAFNYDKLLTKLFKVYDYRMSVLGIGQDGHTAGLLRSYKNEWDKDRLVAGFENRGEFKERITITPKAFRLLDYALVAVSGIDKKDTLERILRNESEDVNNLPGILIHKIKEVDIVSDILVNHP